MGSLAAVLAFVLATTNAKEMTGCAMGPAELDICAHFDDHVVKTSPKILDRGMTSLESFQIGVQPKSDVIYTQVNQSSDV